MQELKVDSFGSIFNVLQLGIHSLPFPIFICFIVSIVLIKTDNQLHLFMPFFVEDWIYELEGGIVDFN